ncbi:FAD-dependent oxidoreductase [Pseudomarimonas arenosa]|uniref:FAD-dependent oxidoreductase n=1 Tax=Pseudomarimonas arenosa TaxID=2774145 RepID=A0AAW3ZTF4_9GAMM|nr:FAD-dependent oxidoreductase [Pseudomarimonas arenosa]MBD8527804.1 FAD-dependent oxidoreductase [Pseudomarimonas arenosa]
MTEHPFAELFEPLQIGPVCAPNRFYQVAHCNGMGHRMPQALAALRGIKAEGGWGVVCTEEVEIHPSGDLSPCFEGRLWDQDDAPALRLMADAVKQQGALAAIQLVHNGVDAPNLYSRLTPIGPRSQGVIGGSGYEPAQTRRMDKRDIAELRAWHRQAARHARQIGFDIIYAYCGHGLSLPFHFLSRRFNDRSDEYGGSLQNRSRLLRELLEDLHDEVGDRCAVALRFSIDELLGPAGIEAGAEGQDLIGLLADLPDLWDVNISGWSNDSLPSRFGASGFQDAYTRLVKSITGKPVVGVGRYTSPDHMLKLIRSGHLDLIGAARPSIADPFLPNKIRELRLEDIRECIGCNICVAADNRSVPIRCSQNPTMGEEWRRGWHPERVDPLDSPTKLLVVGGGPAGLEAALTAARRGADVMLAEAGTQLGGHLRHWSALPGMREWMRVVDWRMTQLQRLPNVAIYPDNPLSADDILALEIDDVIIATGSRWRRDGHGRSYPHGIELAGASIPVLSPDEVGAQRTINGHCLIVDDDHYLMASLLAEQLAVAGTRVTLITSAPQVAIWSQNTLEQSRTQARLMKLGVDIRVQHRLLALQDQSARLQHEISADALSMDIDALLLVTDREPNRRLYDALIAAGANQRFRSLQLIGDAEAPGLLAHAVFSGHLAARSLARPEAQTPLRGAAFRRELPRSVLAG